MMSKKHFLFISILLFFFLGNKAFAQTNNYTGASGGNWDLGTNWSLGVPTTAHDVVIPNNRNVVVNTAAVCNSFSITGGANANTITISGSNSLTVTNAVTINAPTANVTKTITVGAGTLSCGSITFQATGGNSRIASITISTGTLTVSGNVTSGSAQPRNQIVASGAAILNFAGSFTLGGTLINPGTTSTINFNGNASQTVPGNAALFFTNTNYPTVNFTGTGRKTFSGAFQILAGRTMTINAASEVDAAGNQITASGATATININGRFFTTDPQGFSGSTTTAISTTNTSITLGANSTIVYSLVGAQAVTARTYSNLQIKNSNTKTLDAGTTTVSGSLGIANFATLAVGTATLNVTGTTRDTGTLTISTGNMTLTGNTFVSGTMTLSGATGTKIFVGKVTVSGTFNNSGNGPLQIDGSFANTGTTTMGTGLITFAGSGLDTVSSTTTLAFGSITLNKGTDFTNHVLEMSSVFTIGATGLTLTNGTFKVASASTVTLFAAEIGTNPGLVPATAGLWINNGLAVINHPYNFSYTGLVRITAGTINVGDANDERFRTMGGTFILDGGTVNVSGRFSRPDTAPNSANITISSGTMTVGTVGNTSAVYPPFGMESGSTFNMSGGTIIIQQAGNAGTSNFGILLKNTAGSITGGTIQFGNASTPASQTMNIRSRSGLPSIVINNATLTCVVDSVLIDVQNNVTITAGTLNLNNNTMRVAGNWSNSGTFTPGTGTVIFDSTLTQTITDASGETFHNLTMNKASGVLQMNNNVTVSNTLALTSGTLAINGNTLAMAGTLTGSGLIRGSATSNISITGTGALGSILMDNTSQANKTLNNFTINRTSTGTATVGATDSMFIQGALTITNGTITTNGRLQLLSNASGTARVAPITCGSCGLTGNIIVQRFVPGGANKRRWRLMGIPVNVSGSVALTQIIDDTWVTGTGNAANGFDDPGSTPAKPSLRFYNEPTASTADDQTWTNPANINVTIPTAQGYTLFVRGSRSLANPFLINTVPDNATIDYVGTMNTGNITYNLSFTNNSLSVDGFNLVGNPYPSQINFDAASGWTKTNVDNKIWAFNPVTLTYNTFDADANIGTNGLTAIIPSGQGFFVRANAPSASITFTEPVKSSSSSFDYFRSAGEQPLYPYISLNLRYADTLSSDIDSLAADELVVAFDSSAHKNDSDKIDTYKFFNTNLNFYSKASNNTNLAINFHPMVSDTDTINISIFSRSSAATNILGKYEITRTFFNSIELLQGFVLADYFTNTFIDLRDFEKYEFEITSAAASAGNNRFKLISYFNPISQGISNTPLQQVLMYPNPTSESITIQIAKQLPANAQLEVMIFDLQGRVLSTEKLGMQEHAGRIAMDQLAPGMYMVRVAMGKEILDTQRIIKQ
jgi:hypothetical protein